MLVVQADRHGDVELVLAPRVEKMLRQLCAIATTPLPDGALDLVAMCHAPSTNGLSEIWSLRRHSRVLLRAVVVAGLGLALPRHVAIIGTHIAQERRD
jgi:hypothetical protein